MKVLLYSNHQNMIEKSGVGRALRHQEKALELVGVPFTHDAQANYDVIHINTIFPASYRAAKRAKKQGKKVVYHAHSTGEDFRNSFIFSNAIAPLFTKWIKRCYEPVSYTHLDVYKRQLPGRPRVRAMRAYRSR